MCGLRNRFLGRECRCDTLFEGFKWCELRDLSSSVLPRAPGVYVLRIIEKGEDLEKSSETLLALAKRTRWTELLQYVESRLKRLNKVEDCPVVYVGSTATLSGRLKDLAGRRHTAFFPLFVVLYSGWRVDYGFLKCSTIREAGKIEENLKHEYVKIHGNPPALVEH